MTTLGDLLDRPGRVLGTWAQVPAPEVLDMIGLNGFDFVVIDCEHGAFGIETAERMARAAAATGLAAAVRVSRCDPIEIMKALDAGMPHIVVPNVTSVDEAERAVAATRFAPGGLRGACPCVRSGGHYVRDWPRYARDEEARTGILPLIESAEGIAEIAAIAATPGLVGLVAGPFDLSVSLGLDGDWRHGRVQDGLDRLVDTASANDLPVIMPVFAPEPEECAALISHWSERGVETFLIGSDKILIANAFHSWVKRLG
ncbi:MAG: aldolase/citrate lyase family protein [Pseudomonadota bacterium]